MKVYKDIGIKHSTASKSRSFEIENRRVGTMCWKKVLAISGIVATSLIFSNPVNAGFFDWGNNSNQPQQPTQQQQTPTDPATLVIQKSQQRQACIDRCNQQYSQNRNRCPRDPVLSDPFGYGEYSWPVPDSQCDLELQQINFDCMNSCN